MQRYRYTIGALIIFIALLAWVLAQERGRVPEKGEVFGLQVSQISELEVEQGNQKIALHRHGDNWHLTKPTVGLADTDAVERMVKAVAQLKPEVRPDADLTNPDYGLTEPVMVVKFTGPQQKSTTIKLGTQTPVRDHYFATISGRPHLYLISTAFKSNLTKNLDDLRQRKLIPGLDAENVRKITITRGDWTLVAEKIKEDGQSIWQLRQPLDTKADRRTVESVIDTISGAEGRDFAEPTEDMSIFGLDQPQAVIALEREEKPTITVRLGREIEKEVKKRYSTETETKQLVYTQSDGRPDIVLVEADLVEDISKDVFAFRDKHIVDLSKVDVIGIKVERKKGLTFTARLVGDEWELDSPAGIKPEQTRIDDIIWDLQNLEATQFVEEQADDMAEYDLSLPSTVITLTLRGGQPLQVFFSDQIEGTTDHYCYTSQSRQVFRVHGIFLRGLPRNIDDLKAEETSPPDQAGPD